MIILICCGWYALGLISFCYWWTNEFDLTTNQIPYAMAAGLVGPLAFIIGFIIHGNARTPSKVIFKKRR